MHLYFLLLQHYYWLVYTSCDSAQKSEPILPDHLNQYIWTDISLRVLFCIPKYDSGLLLLSTILTQSML